MQNKASLSPHYEETLGQENALEEFFQYIYVIYGMRFIGYDSNHHMMFSHPSCPATPFVGILSPEGEWTFHTREGLWIRNPKSYSPLFYDGRLLFDVSQIDFDSFEQMYRSKLLFYESFSLKQEKDRIHREQTSLAAKRAKWDEEAKQARLAEEARLAEAERLAALEAERLAAIDPEDEARRNYRLSEDVAGLISGLQTLEDIEKFLPTFNMHNPSHTYLMGIVMLLYSWVPFSFKTVSSSNPGKYFKIPDRESETGMYKMFIRIFLLVTKSIHRSAHKELSENVIDIFVHQICVDPWLRTKEGFATRYCDAGCLLMAFDNWFREIKTIERHVHSVRPFLPSTGNTITKKWWNFEQNFPKQFEQHLLSKFPFIKLTQKERENLNNSYIRCLKKFLEVKKSPFNLHHPFVELLAVVFNDIYDHLRSFSEFEFRPIRDEHELAGTTEMMIIQIIEHFDRINETL